MKFLAGILVGLALGAVTAWAGTPVGCPTFQVTTHEDSVEIGCDCWRDITDPCLADFDGSGSVGAPDFVIFSALYGQACGV